MGKDEVIFFEPPDNCNSFPKGAHQPMFYFNTSRTCIIPQKGYNNGDNASTNAKKMSVETVNKDHKQKQLEATISSQSACNGAIMVLSFHVESYNEIRCYIYMNGQVLRFLPEDIALVLPQFFDESFGDNKDFPTSDQAKELIAEMNKKLKDVKFKAFLNKYKSKN